MDETRQFDGEPVPGEELPDQPAQSAGSPTDQEGGPTVADASALEQALAERDQYRELALRARADFENYQKRVARDLASERKYAAQPFIMDLLPVLDNLDRALEAANGEEGGAGIIDGIRIVRKQLGETLAKHGVEAIQPREEPFDPHLHEAVYQQPTNDQPPMTVLQTFRNGYKLHDRVIRPAQVAVSCPAAQDAADQPNDESER